MKELHIILYTEDAVKGMTLPLRWKLFVDKWEKKSIKADRPISVFTEYNKYKKFEVESSHQARDGSHGTTYYENTKDNISKFKNWFSDWYDNEWDELLKFLP